MDGSQYDAIETRRKVIKQVLLENADSISALIALGSYTRDKYDERVSCAIQKVNKLADEKLGITR